MLSVVAMIACLAGPIVSPAQEKPGFSGNWVLESPLDAGLDVPRSLVVEQSSARPAGRGALMPSFVKDIVVDRQFANGVQSYRYHIGLISGSVGRLDGNGRGAGPDGTPSRTSVAVRWDGDRLVFETARYSGLDRASGPYTIRREVWELTSEGRLVILVTEETSAAKSKTQTLTYRR